MDPPPSVADYLRNRHEMLPFLVAELTNEAIAGQ